MGSVWALRRRKEAETEWREHEPERPGAARWDDSRRVTRHSPQCSRGPRVEMPLYLRHALEKRSQFSGCLLAKPTIRPRLRWRMRK